MTVLLLGEGCPFVPEPYYYKKHDIDEEIILLAYSLMVEHEPDRKPEINN